MQRVCQALLLCLGVVACRSDEVLSRPAAPHLPSPFIGEPAAGLQFSASISKSVVAIGDTATIAFVLHNPTQQTVTLRFSSTCQILPYIRDSAGIVHPRGGGWGCGAALTSLSLSPGEARVMKVIVHGGVPREAMHGVVPLNPGEHHAYAELGDGMGRSPAVAFSITAD